MEPAPLVNILRAHSDEPVFAVAQIRAKLHYHIRELVQVGSCPKILHGLVFEHAYFLGGKSVHLDDFQGLAVEFERERELFKLPESFVEADEAPHVFGAFVTLILLQELQVVVHLVYVEAAVLTEKHLTFTVISDMPCQPVLHLTDVHLTEGAFLLLSALAARLEVSFTVLIREGVPAFVGAAELAHIENVSNLPRYLHLLEVLLAEGADGVVGQPLVQTRTTDQAFAVGARREIFQYVGTYWTHELLENLLEFWPRILGAKLFKFVCRYGRFQPFVNVGDELCCPLKRRRLLTGHGAVNGRRPRLTPVITIESIDLHARLHHYLILSAFQQEKLFLIY